MFGADSRMIGKTNGQAGNTINIGPNERIVAVKYKDDKHMYRYGLQFMIAN